MDALNSTAVNAGNRECEHEPRVMSKFVAMFLAEKIAEACQRELHAHGKDNQSHEPRHHVVQKASTVF